MVDTTTHDVMVAQTEKAQELLDYFQGHRDALEGDRIAHGAAVTAELGNLAGVVASELDKTLYVDNSLTEAANNSFPTIKAAVESLPSGSRAEIKLNDDQVHAIESGIISKARFVLFTRRNDGSAMARITAVAYAVNGYNNMPGLYAESDSALFFSNLGVDLPAAKADAGLAWSTLDAFIRPRFGGYVSVGLSGCEVTGGENLGLTKVQFGSLVRLGLRSVTLDGAFLGVAGVTSGLALISKSAVTLANGAALQSGGTLGTHYLQN